VLRSAAMRVSAALAKTCCSFVSCQVMYRHRIAMRVLRINTVVSMVWAVDRLGTLG